MLFYILNNFITKQNYLFIEPISEETDKLINKFVNDSISDAEMATLVKTYHLPKTLPDSLTVFKFPLKNLTILDLKKYISSLLDIPYQRLHLWIRNSDMENYIKMGISKRNKADSEPDLDYSVIGETLGYIYKNELGIKYYNPALTKLDIVEREPSDEYIDLHSYLLGSYRGIMEHTIYFIDYDEFDFKDNSEIVKDLFFKDYSSIDLDEFKVNKEHYKEIYSNFNRNVVSLNLVRFKKEASKFSLKFVDEELSNVIIYSNINCDKDIRLEELYSQIEPTEKVAFIKFRNFIKNVFFKINKDAIYRHTQKKSSDKGFNNYKNYLVDYEYKKYEPKIPRKKLESWCRKLNISREEKFKEKRDVLTFKIDLSNIQEKLYLSLSINSNGMVEIKILELNEEIYINNKQLDEIIDFVNKYIRRLKKADNGIELVDKINTTIVSLNNTSNFRITSDVEISLADLRNEINKYFSLGYVVDNDENTITLKSRGSEFYSQYENLKAFYNNLKETNKSLSLAEFQKLWINISRINFNLSPIDAISTQTLVNQDLEKKDLSDNLDITIRNGIEVNHFILVIRGYNKFEYIDNIRAELENIVYGVILRKTTKSKAKAENTPPISKEIIRPIIVQQIKKQAVFDQEEGMALSLDDDSDSDSDSDSEDEEDDSKPSSSGAPAPAPAPTVVAAAKMAANIEPNNNGDDEVEELETKMPKSITEYMTKLRKRDSILFPPKYTRQCPIVNGRQPIILTKLEIENMKKKGLKGYESIKDDILAWGSSNKKVYYYICPRIWCIKCKIVLTDREYIEKKGKCKICGGSEIMVHKKIKPNETILIRKATYLKQTQVPKEFLNEINKDKDLSAADKERLKEDWKLYLKDSEKASYPGLLDKSKHPLNLCMPCCFASKVKLKKKDTNIEFNKNLDNCYNIDVNYILDVKLEELREGASFKGIMLVAGDVVLLMNNDPKTNNFYLITKEGAKELKYLGSLNIEFRNGMLVQNLSDGRYYTIYKEDEIFKKLVFKKKEISVDYIVGSDKFPLEKDKFGILHDKLDKLFNKKSLPNIKKGVQSPGTTLVFRKGVNQNVNNSFIEALCVLKKMDSFSYLSELVKFLTPDVFVSLNNGEINKYFYQETKFVDSLSFKNWCILYKDSLQLLNYDRNALFNIYVSMENYKKYLCDLNIYKDFNLIIDLVSRENPELHERGLNILILELDSLNHVKLLNPLIKDLNNIYNDERENLLMVKVGHYFEPLYEVHKNKETMVTSNYNFKELKNIRIVANLKSVLSKYKDTKLSYYKLLPDIAGSQYEFDSQIVDKYFKGIGILTKNQMIIYTDPFNVDFSKPLIEKHKVPRMSLDETVKNYNELYKFLNVSYKIEHLVKDGDIVHSVVTSNDNYIPIINEKFTLNKHKLNVIEDKNYEGIDDVLFSEKMVVDERIKLYNEVDLNKTIYDNLKLELSQFFKRLNNDSRKQINLYLQNNVVDISTKRFEIINLVKNILENLVVFDKPEVIKSDYSCGEQSKDDCVESKCRIGRKSSSIVKFNKRDFKIDTGECKMIIDRDNYEKFYLFLSDELVRFPNKRRDIIQGRFKIPIEKELKSNIVVLNGLDYLDKIKDLYLINKYIYVNDYFNFILKNSEHKKVKKSDFNKNIPKLVVKTKKNSNSNNTSKNSKKNNSIKVIEPDPSILKPPVSSPPRPGGGGAPAPKPGEVHTSSPGPRSAELVDLSGKIIKIPGTQKPIYATTIGWDDIDHEGEKNVKAGKCFKKYKIKLSKKNQEGRDKNGCIYHPSNPKSYGKICATSVNGPGPRIGYLKTYGYCPKPKGYLTKKKSLGDSVMADITDRDGKPIPSLDTTKYKAGLCQFPYKIIRRWPKTGLSGKQYGLKYKDSQKVIKVSDCMPTSGTENKYEDYLCATTVRPDRTIVTRAFCKTKKNNNTNNTKNNNTTKKNNGISKTKLPERYAQQYYYDETTGDKIQPTNPKRYRGKCIFPFKTRKSGARFNYRCLTRKEDGMPEECPTKLTSSGLGTDYGFCIPKGETYESYNDKYVGKNKNNSNNF